jgi:hypothetical protein
MAVMRRKRTKKWERAVGKMGRAAGAVAQKSATRTAAGALAGAATLTTASAVVSAVRRKSESS